MFFCADISKNLAVCNFTGLHPLPKKKPTPVVLHRQRVNNCIKTTKNRWCYTKPNIRGRFSALLGPHQHALARMQIYDDHKVKTTARTMRKSQVHSLNIRNSGIYIVE